MGGGTTVTQTPAQKTELSPIGQEIEGYNRDYIKVLSPILQNLATTGGAQVGQGYQPDYSQLYQPGLNQIGAATGTINNLSQGVLPQSFIDNQKAQVSQIANQGIGNILNRNAQKGVVNSSVTRGMMKDLDDSINNSIVNNYNQNLSSLSGLAGQQISAAAAPYNYAAGYQSAATSNAKDLLSLATGSYSPLGSTFSNYLNQQTALSAPAQTSVTQSSSPFGSILGTGLGVWAGKKWG
jgi:hypothetical protein